MHTSLRVTGALSGVESSVVLGLGLRWRTSSEAVHQAAFVVPAHPRRGDVLQVGERPNWPRAKREPSRMHSVLYSLPSCASRRTRIAAVDNTVRNERAHPEAGRKRDAMRAKTRAEADAQRPRGRGLSGSMPGHPLDLDVASDLIPPGRRDVSGHTSPTIDQAKPGRPRTLPLTRSRPRLSPTKVPVR
jgi:hypothetical protein